MLKLTDNSIEEKAVMSTTTVSSSYLGPYTGTTITTIPYGYNTYGGNYYPGQVIQIGGSGTFTINGMSPMALEYNLSGVNKSLLLSGKEIIKNKLYAYVGNDIITYDRVSTTYIVLIENDLEGDINHYTQIKEFFQTRRGLMVIAYDMLLNRLELSSVCKEDEPIANIDMLLDHELQIKPDKTDYFSSLKSRFLPIVNYKISSIDNNTITLEKNTKAGLFPVIHTPNYIYNLQNPKKEQVQKASNLLNNLLCEGYLLDKECLPEVQPYFSPEYAYLSLRSKKEITEALRVFDKSKQGLINLLQNITVAGTSVVPFVEAVISQCALNQSIINIEEYAYIAIRNLVETNIC